MSDMPHPLPFSFFNRSAIDAAHDLLGSYLVRKIDGKIERHMITETEAYEGPLDQASHAFRGRTKRTEIMFGPPGYIYVYLIYGMYSMLNVVTGPKDHPAAVLIRGIKGCNGPGRLTKKLSIDRELNGKILGPESNLWIEAGEKIDEKRIIKTPRVGIDYAGPIWSQKEYRFVLQEED